MHFSNNVKNIVKKFPGRFRKVGTSLALALALGVPLVAPQPSFAAAASSVDPTVNWYAPDRVSTLLQKLQTLNARLTSNGQTLETFSRSTQHSWQSHSYYLNAVRDDVNESGKVIRELQSIQYGALPWQKQAIDRIHPIALDLAQRTSAAISHLSANQGRLAVPEYREHLAAISDSAEKMQSTVNNFIDYGQAQQKAQDLGQMLEIADS